MTELRGVGIGLGVTHGPVARMAEPLPAPQDEKSALTADEETARVRAAVDAVARELEQRGETAGGAAQEVLEAQAMMAEDPALEDEVATRIAAGKTGEFAVFDAFASFRDSLAAMGGYLGERAADLDDVAQRVIANLRGVAAPGVPDPGHPFVLVAKDLAPADTALLDLDKVLALVTTEGGPTSHTAILAREKSIVAIVGVHGAADLADGETVIVDAAGGVVTTEPTDDDIAQAERREADRAAAADAPITPGALADGTAVPLLANLGKPQDAAKAVELGAEGVGLFRTEFLFLSSSQAPTVDEQTKAYTELLQAFPGKKVVVRALDAGADKPLAFLNDAHEENPALGLRGLRALRASEDILREQLTALANADAAADADLWVMAPMVSTVEETEYFVTLAKEYGVKTAGVMVEVPSSALMADKVLAHADFASIGTNDLTQYTLAADRLLGSVASFQDPWHPAVLHLVKATADGGRTNGKPVGICGEAAADPLLAVVLVGLGATTLSMAPTALADVRATLLHHSFDDAQRIAEAALAASDAASARAAAQEAATQHKEN
ncbi:phosphoenolpyruvate--protein phosphotransferase [Microbacterium sp. EYE_5]|uniref:phosphoenolpyruvate--protein phosphotransferase n=1 Tax=unclassified Microbacterium TaxID=2609290 RepID=UPI0020068963|nr:MULTISPECIES: phosphoenolpyruvate--protein phosphotransferase [unclassified Microbacterium]MCK6081554.1 phosphoenolpyruvate--protein phosphotransferase [Microbacterium sp. EYE_382]MCK6086824.1 phosphoenolpyruvate--protein phosphotransferase [Microbacterium sp. EYE_384]MCK6123678.1 phosphoenolpyruvate--protein phosphotransferase [Microbacterium sp. EYE_80]MCK6126587.1 phosphoenolpyruvate--protein phosphotransferase [Microbacterium sp. EYE_79]MCK6142508.1 phosphoenolpyruvate--protein phosphot